MNLPFDRKEGFIVVPEPHLALECDVNAKSKNGVTPLQTAEEQGWSANAWVLEELAKDRIQKGIEEGRRETVRRDILVVLAEG